MSPASRPLPFLLAAFAGGFHQQQFDVIDYLQTENRVLREQLGARRVRFTDDQRVRLAAKAKTLGRRALQDIGTLVTPDTLLAWHRGLIARKYDDRHRAVHPAGHTSWRGSKPWSYGWPRRIAPGVWILSRRPATLRRPSRDMTRWRCCPSCSAAFAHRARGGRLSRRSSADTQIQPLIDTANPAIN
jgi:hypothetical protein